MSAPETANPLDPLLADLNKLPAPTLPDLPPNPDPLLAQFLFAFLLWEASEVKALHAMKRVCAAVVDFNELRVFLHEELAGLLGARYPRLEERCLRIRAALNQVFEREHAVTLDSLRDTHKRECRAYLESLSGVPAFVASRITLLQFGGHACPMDDRLLGVVNRFKPSDAPLDVAGAGALFERFVRAGDLEGVYLRLEAKSALRPRRILSGASPKASTRQTRTGPGST